LACLNKLRRFGVVENTAALDNCGTNKRKKLRVLDPAARKWPEAAGQAGQPPDKGTVDTSWP
jgi:hypothetical protein